MPLKIIRNDITKVKCDAIVNAAKSSLLGGGGVDGAIHKAAGRELLAECRKLGGCAVGQAKITGGYRLPCRYVIHTVGPVWNGGQSGEENLLRSCYRSSLELAKAHGCQSVAFPLISSGNYGYPKDRALKAAMDEISSFLLENDMLVFLVIYDKDSFQIGGKLFADIRSFIDDKYVEERKSFLIRRNREGESNMLPQAAAAPSAADIPTEAAPAAFSPAAQKPARLEDILQQVDESFSQMLLRKIDEKGMTDSQCYKKANVDRKLFSKIRSDIHYHPSKTTALAFAVALELNLAETKDMLMKAGYALSRSSKFDLIIEYFISAGNYDIFEINEALFAFDQVLLG